MSQIKRTFFLLCLIIILGLNLFSNLIYSDSNQANKLFRENLKDLYNYLPEFLNDINKVDDHNIRSSYKVLRKKFKKIQFISEHLDPEVYKLNLNGAPLPKIDPFDTQILVKEPSGLQVMDELISEQIIERNELLKVFSKFKKELEKIIVIQSSIPLNDRLIFESIRQDIVRIMSLSLSGFESPAFLNGIEDTRNSLSAQLDFINLYKDKIIKKDKNLFDTILRTYISAQEFLKDNLDFNTFDRFTFTSLYLRDLYRLIYELHILLEVETYDEVNITQVNWNYNNKELFSENLYNLYSFSYLNHENDSQEKVILGKTLFFDPILSANSERACASCHNPSKAFTDGLPKSMATDFNGTLNRNSPTLINSIISNGFFYDLRANLIENQIEHVILNKDEFNTTNEEIIKKLNSSNEYKEFFLKAFPEIAHNDKINITTIGIAISSFIKSLTSFNSQFDLAMRNQNQINQSIKNGYNLFMGKALCGTCHFAPSFNGTVPPYFSDTETEVLGVPKISENGDYELDDDLGRYLGKLKQRADFYRNSFKTVTVRNIELTAPYMHNGVFKDLDEVMDFYNKGGGVGFGFKVENQTLPFDSLNLSKQEVNDIISFMKSLTDTTNMTTPIERLPKINNYTNRKIGGKY